jgi:RIO-like serine/threonine protein kinase
MSLGHLYLKHFQAPLRVLNFIEHSTRMQNYVMFSQVQAHLKRNKNQVFRVLGTLVDEELVIKE